MKAHQHSSGLPSIQSSAPSLPSREEQANAEVGHTIITRAQCRVLAGAFLFLVFAVPVIQHIREFRTEQDTGLLRMVRLPAVARREAGETSGAGIQLNDRRGGWFGRVFGYNSRLLREINQFDDDVVAESVLTRTLVPPVQWFLAGALGAGNEKAYVGRDGWLFYRPDVDYSVGPGFLDEKRLVVRARSGSEWVAAPQPDPLIAIFQFRRQLAERGIALAIVVAPPKTAIHPERFSFRYEPDAPPVHNPSFEQFVQELEEPERFFQRWGALLAPYRNVPEEKARRAWYWPLREALRELEAARELIVAHPVILVDPSPDLAATRQESGASQYLTTDTHWTPEAMQRVAARVRERVAGGVKWPAVTMNYRRDPVKASQLGDIAMMMKLPAGQKLYGSQEVTVQQVTLGESQWRPDRNADVLLLGDSFSNIYSAGDMGWGEAAGFAEQLSFELGRPLDAIIRNDAGAHATREMLSQELAQGRDRLAGKKLVIWEFAGRELSSGDWRVASTPMRLGPVRQSRFLAVAGGTSRRISGVVQEASTAPRPGTVTYRDHVVQVHLTGLEAADGQPLDATEALVAITSMRNQVWTPAARYRPGQKLTLTLRNYAEVDRLQKVGSIKSSLLSGDLELETACWGEDEAAAAGAPEVPETPTGTGWMEWLGLLVVVAGIWIALATAERYDRAAMKGKEQTV